MSQWWSGYLTTRTRLFLGHPNLTFQGWVDTRLYPNPTFSDFWVNFMQIYGYPKELPDFFGTQIRLSLLFRLLDPTRIRLFTTRTIQYPTFCYPLHHQYELQLRMHQLFYKLYFLFFSCGASNFHHVLGDVIIHSIMIIYNSYQYIQI